MASGEGRFSIWVVAIGTFLGGLGGAATVVSLVRDFNNPISRALLDDKRRLGSNNQNTQNAFIQERTQEDAAWQMALKDDTPEAYGVYCASYPSGRYVSDALARRSAGLESRAWQAAISEGTREGYDVYLASYPTGVHAEAASSARKESPHENRLSTGDLASVAQSARAAVSEALSIIPLAEDAQRRAKNHEVGYASTVESAQIINHLGGQFDGKLGVDEGIFVNYKYPSLGVWSFSTVAVGSGGLVSVVTQVPAPAQNIKAQVSQWDSTSMRLSGEILYPNGDKYLGEFKTQSVYIVLDGLGALWSDKGTVLRSGQWKDGEYIGQ